MSCDNLQKFSFNLYNSLVSEQEDFSRNIFFSPISVYAAFASLLVGTKGDSETELLKALHLTNASDDKEMHKMIAAQFNQLMVSSAETKVAMANRLFVETNFTLKKDFASCLKEVYSSEPENVSFEKNAEEARENINKWVKSKTENKISELFPKNSIDTRTVLVIANALYFKGLWTLPFKKSDTKDGKFDLLDGSSKDIKLMFKNSKYSMCEFSDLDSNAIFLPFKNSHLSLFIMLPNQRNGLPQLMRQLFQTSKSPDGTHDATNLQHFLSSRNYFTQEINLYLPRFKIGGEEPSISLVDNLKSMGVESIFVRGKANLSGLSDAPNLLVSSVLHRAVLEIDEEGAEAAAATGMGIMMMCMPPPPIDMRVTHPFIIAIADNQGTPLFLGHVSDPK